MATYTPLLTIGGLKGLAGCFKGDEMMPRGDSSMLCSIKSFNALLVFKNTFYFSFDETIGLYGADKLLAHALVVCLHVADCLEHIDTAFLVSCSYSYLFITSDYVSWIWNLRAGDWTES